MTQRMKVCASTVYFASPCLDWSLGKVGESDLLARFDARDRNHDGSVTSEERGSYREARRAARDAAR